MDTSSTTPTLYHYWRSSCSWRVRWALELKNIAYTSIAINLVKNEQNSPAFLKVNPLGVVPALVLNNQVYTESLAIVDLIDTFYSGYPIIPQTREERITALQIAQIIACDIQPLQNLSVMRRISADITIQKNWSHYWIQKGLETLETIVSKTAGTYCIGGRVSVADLFLIPQCYNAMRFNIRLENYPILNGIYQRSIKTSPCDRAAPQNQQGAIK
jgi:maleylacetoacetate isomerase